MRPNTYAAHDVRTGPIEGRDVSFEEVLNGRDAYLQSEASFQLHAGARDG